ncbi:MAG: DUF3598 family protein [Gloeocapsa sp. DLM2.Bin57]|nr:MAG: DUF3598 family protein [Gloeocapsa sp. DLM2.Bin57]
MAKSQWECLLENLGEWYGSFTRLSPTGEIKEDTPTIVSLEGRDDNQTIHQVVRYLPPNQPPQETVLTYSSLSRNILFRENGAFSQGSLFWSPWSQCGAELGLINGDRRLRLVILFNQGSQPTSLTLIREKLPHSNQPENPPLTIEQLLGTWQGTATTISTDFSQSPIQTTQLVITRENNQLSQKLSFAQRTITSVAQIKNCIIEFETSKPPVRVLLLPDGASAAFPLAIEPGVPFFLEIGWLIKPTIRQRLIRNYNSKGEWTGLTFVQENLTD